MMLKHPETAKPGVLEPVFAGATDFLGRRGSGGVGVDREADIPRPSVAKIPAVALPLAHPSATIATRSRLRGPHAAVADIGCGVGSNTKTFFSIGNFEGDGSRMDFVLRQTRNVAKDAHSRGNHVCYGILGNVVPDVHHAAFDEEDAEDSLTKAVKMATSVGIPLDGEGTIVKPQDVTLIIGSRELAWLRLINQSASSREISPHFDDENVQRILQRKTPLHEIADHTNKLPTWFAHNESLSMFNKKMDQDVAAVAMLLKLVSMSQMTMNAPGLVRVFTKKLLCREPNDLVVSVPYTTLIRLLETYNGTIEEGMQRLIRSTGEEDGESDRLELTPEGLGVLPAAKAVVVEVLKFAFENVKTYMEKGKLIHCVMNRDTEGGDGGLWLTAIGTDNARMVGKLPERAVVLPHTECGIGVKYTEQDKQTSNDRIEWSKKFNEAFTRFLQKFVSGNADDKMFEAYIAMAIASHETSLPLLGLSHNNNTKTSCQGVCSNTVTPFGTIQRRVLVEKSIPDSIESDLKHVLESWSSINTSAYTSSTYWNVTTWCGATRANLESPPPPVFDRSEKLFALQRTASQTLMSVLSAPCGDGIVGYFGVEKINGLIGPVVSASAHGTSNQIRQPMRVVSFTHESIDTAFVVLLPEEIVQTSLDYGNYDLKARASAKNAPFMSVRGVLAFPHEAAIHTNPTGLCETKVDDLHANQGIRVWALPKKRDENGNRSFTTADYYAITTMHNYDGTAETDTLSIPGYKIFHTEQGSFDPFSGLNVALAPLHGKEGGVTLDSNTTPYHALFRVV
tara:strand:+ start:1792 stop:4170 length:2379 start_codon:yes stop_codon:yes gene_type:complete